MHPLRKAQFQLIPVRANVQSIHIGVLKSSPYTLSPPKTGSWCLATHPSMCVLPIAGGFS